MQVYISADLEGISGVVAGDQTSTAGADYGRARKLMTEEVNAAVRGALGAGADKVVVNDGHGGMRNILIEDLVPEARLITGSPKTMGQMEGIDYAGDFDACVFIGYHSRAGTPGVLNHTISGRVVFRVQINGIEVGETGLNAALAGHYGIPLAMVSGDSDVCTQAKDLVPSMVTVPVKEAAGRYAALCLSPEKAREAIEEGVSKALERVRSGDAAPFVVNGPVSVSLRTFDTAMADLAAVLPGACRKDHLEVVYEADDVPGAYSGLRAMIYLASCSRR